MCYFYPRTSKKRERERKVNTEKYNLNRLVIFAQRAGREHPEIKKKRDKTKRHKGVGGGAPWRACKAKRKERRKRKTKELMEHFLNSGFWVWKEGDVQGVEGGVYAPREGGRKGMTAERAQQDGPRNESEQTRGEAKRGKARRWDENVNENEQDHLRKNNKSLSSRWVRGQQSWARVIGHWH